jgi:hypothetical protein
MSGLEGRNMAAHIDPLKKAFKDVTDGIDWGYSMAEITRRFWRTRDKTVQNFLATIVLDESRPRDIRLAGYCALFEVSGRDLWTLAPMHEFKIPDNLDLPFLKECLEGRADGEEGDIPKEPG